MIERFAGEVPPRFLAGPNWGLIRNEEILALIEKRLEEKDTWQGRLYKEQEIKEFAIKQEMYKNHHGN